MKTIKYRMEIVESYVKEIENSAFGNMNTKAAWDLAVKLANHDETTNTMRNAFEELGVAIAGDKLFYPLGEILNKFCNIITESQGD
jgi:hypothetical protein